MTYKSEQEKRGDTACRQIADFAETHGLSRDAALQLTGLIGNVVKVLAGGDATDVDAIRTAAGQRLASVDYSVEDILPYQAQALMGRALVRATGGKLVQHYAEFTAAPQLEAVPSVAEARVA